MKNLQQILIVTALFFILSFSSTNAKAQTLTDYNNQVLYYYTLLDNQVAKFEAAIWDDKATTADLNKEFKLTKNICKYEYPVLKRIETNKKDKYFYKSVVNYYDVVSNVLSDEFQQVMDMYNQDWKDEFGSKISDLDKQAVAKVIEGEDNVIDSQKKFADENNLDLN